MDYQETITKLCQLQRKIMPTLETLQHEGKLPHDLRIAKDEALEWEDVIDGKAGLENAPSMKPVKNFAKALAENLSLFSAEKQEDIDAYRVLAAELPEVWNDPLTE